MLRIRTLALSLLLAGALAGCGEEPTVRGDGPEAAADAGPDEAGAGADVRAPVEGDGGVPPPADQGAPPPADQGAPPPADQGAPPPPDKGVPPPADQGAPPPADQGVPPLTTEVLLFDGKGLQFTAADKGFDPLINPGDPLPINDWLTPDDYYDGDFRVRYVIEGPPGQEGGKLQVCIWTMPGYSPESCGPQVAHSGVGVYDAKGPVSSWWKKDGKPLDFSHPEKFLIRVVLRGASGCNVTSYSVSNGCWDEWPKYENMKYRVTIVMVPKGKTFSGWPSYP